MSGRGVLGLVLAVALLGAPVAAWGQASVIRELTPPAAAVGDRTAPGLFTLTILGEHFTRGATVLWNGAPRATTFVSETVLEANITADVAAPTIASVAVSDGGGVSSAVRFEVSPLKARLVFPAGTEHDTYELGTAAPPPLTIVLQIENVSGADLIVPTGFSTSTDLVRRLYFVEPNGGIVINKAEELIHVESRVYHCFSRRRVLQRPTAIPVVPAELLPAGYFKEYRIEDARRLYRLVQSGRYTVDARIPLQTFNVNDRNAVIDDCDQFGGRVVVNVGGVSGSQSFTVRSNTLQFTAGGDVLPPVVVAEAAPAANAAGWNNTTPVTVTVTATEEAGGSGVANVTYTVTGSPTTVPADNPPSFTTSFTIEGEGAQTVTYSATDAAGNTSAAASLAVRIDTIPPVVRCDGADGAWHANDVTAVCTATDATSGLPGGSTLTFSLATSVAPGTETANAATGSLSVCDIAGNCTTAGPVGGHKVDKKAPTVTVTVPASDATYTQGAVILASYACTDLGSGVASCAGPVASGAAIDTASVGAKTFEVTGRDTAGNTTTRAVTYTVAAPTTPPLTSAAVSPAPNASGWHRNDVTVTFTATDTSGSGVRSITYTVNGVPTTVLGSTATTTITAEGTTALTYHATDNAGTAEPSKSLTLRIDKTAPAISLAPAPASYLLNSTITVTFGATDTGGSGVAQVEGSLAKPGTAAAPITSPATVRLDRVGTTTASVTASDVAGNTATASAQYPVVYRFSGFLNPLTDDTGCATPPCTTIRLGSTLPVKFQLFDASNAVVSAAIATIAATQVSGTPPAQPPMDLGTGNVDSGNRFRFDASSNEYHFNLDTRVLSVGVWRIDVVLDDGTTHSVRIGLR